MQECDRSKLALGGVMMAQVKSINKSVYRTKDGQNAATGMVVNMYDDLIDQEKITQEKSMGLMAPRSNGFSSLSRG